MKSFLIWSLILLTLAGISAAAYEPAAQYWKARNAPQWRFAAVSEGKIVAFVNATGSVKPVRSLTIGSFVSGPIDPSVPIAEFNQEVQAGDLLCKIDPRIHNANLQRDAANLESSLADLGRVHAQLEQAERDLSRVTKLREKDKTFIAETELDKYSYNVLSFKAQLGVADANVKVARSQVEYSETQLKYCEIRAPEAGIIINRKIDPGQMLAAQFQTPELFVIAPNLRERIDLHASVDEADVGLIRQAQERKLPVTFTVDACADELFHGTIKEVRMNSATTQNVVTFPVIVAAENADLKLLPGMTASISFEVDERAAVVKIPNSALRFFPNSAHVRKEDQKLVDGQEARSEPDNQAAESEKMASAEQRSELRRKRNRRHVWVAENGLLKAVEVVTGLSDNRYTEMVEGELKPGDQLVTGQIVPVAGFGGPR
ncbi:MAG: efflux RND transporter periplasmic adaptor subunit [Planctomycetia bacterium]|nr:efflux RND transporter periplasmic adaptor subunit [Planctomycetia bacterium]